MRACSQPLPVSVVQRHHEGLGLPVAETRFLSNERCGAGWLAEASAPWVDLRSHPNVADLYAVESEGHYILLLSEPVRGLSLGELLEEGCLRPDLFECLVRQLGSALHHAHSQRVTHGSLNPAAIAFDEGGCLKLLRWPVEHLAAWGDDWSVGPAPFLMHYQAPEQIRAQMSQITSDVYGFGALLFRLAAGRTPFEGPDLASLCSQILSQPAPHLEPPPGYPARLAAVVSTCLSKGPENRPFRILEIVEALYPGSHPGYRGPQQACVPLLCKGGDNRPRPEALFEPQSTVTDQRRRRRRTGKSQVTIHHEDSIVFDRRVTVSTLLVTSGCTSEWLTRAAGRWMRLIHPGIVPIYGIEGGPRPRILSEPVDAPDLQEFFQVASGEDRRLPPIQFRRLVVGLTRAMQHAHDHRVLHGALAPGCVVLDKDDTVKLLRFSAEHLAAIAGAGREARPLAMLAYQAPEQFFGTTTAASDVYAVGLLLYRVAAGKLPFSLADPGWLADRIANGVAPLVGIPQGYPGDLNDLIAACLSADPALRPKSMLEILYRLYPDEQGIESDLEARRRRHRESLRCMGFGHFEAARADWSELLSLDPLDGQAANNLGVALSRLGRNRSAEEAFCLAARLRPGCPVAAFNLGWALYESGRSADAVKVLNRSLALDSRSAQALHLRGLSRGGEPAINDYLEALRYDPQQTLTYLTLADELEALERCEEAQDYRTQAQAQLLPATEIWPRLLLEDEVPPHWSGGENWPPHPASSKVVDEDKEGHDDGDGDGGARVPRRRPPHAPSASEAKALPRAYEVSDHPPRFFDQPFE